MTSPVDGADAPSDAPTAPASAPDPDPGADPRLLAVPPWGATVAAAMGLLPDAVLADQRPTDTGAPGHPGYQVSARPVAVTDAHAWAHELSATVAVRLTGWTRLPTARPPAPVVPAPTGPPPAGVPPVGSLPVVLPPLVIDPPGLAPRDALVLEARRLVHSGLASYIEQARTGRAPGAGNDATSGYAGILWTRFTEGLTALADYLAAELARRGDGDADGDGIPDALQTAQPAAFFPPPAFTRATGF